MPDNDDFSDDIGFEEDFEEVEVADEDDGDDSLATAAPDESDFLPGAEEEIDDDLSDLQLDGAVSTDDPVRMYLKEIGQVPLLDGNREVWLSTQLGPITCLQDSSISYPRLTSRGRTASGCRNPMKWLRSPTDSPQHWVKSRSADQAESRSAGTFKSLKRCKRSSTAVTPTENPTCARISAR